MPELERQFSVPVAGGMVCGSVTGSGPAVLLLHGGPGLSDYLDLLALELAPRYAAHRYQQRGLPPSLCSGPFHVETHVADAVAVIDALGLKQPWVVGHSWGGYLALHLALAAPDRIRGLLILDPLGAMGDGGQADLRSILEARLSPAARREMGGLDSGPPDGPDAMPATTLSLLWPGYFSSPDSAPPMPPMWVSRRCHADTMASVNKHFQTGTLKASLPQLAAPTIFVLGRDSPIPPRHGEATAALIPGAKARVLPACGHFAWIEQPGSVLSALNELAA